MAIKKKSKPKNKVDREAIIDALYRAVGDYVKSGNGNVIIAGGIQIIKWPSDTPYHFTVGVKCVGREPTFDHQKGTGDD